MFEAHYIEEDFTNVVQALAKGKSLGLDGLMVDFCKSYWCFMIAYFTIMVNESLGHEYFPKGVTCGHIASLFQEGARLKLTN